MVTLSADVVRRVAASSLIVTPQGYRPLGGNAFAWLGERPGPEWHVHGWTEAHPWAIVGGRRVRITVRKRRWRKKDRSATVHSRPPGDIGLRHDALLVVLELWCWLDAAVGLHRYQSLFAGPARRTVQRWLRRALPAARAIQHAFRYAVIERSEPRPLETLFPGGLSPPRSLRRWRDPSIASTLWQGFAIFLIGCSELGSPAAPLLAEARRRWTETRGRFLLP